MSLPDKDKKPEAVPVKADQNNQVVYAIPAKKKPKTPWIYENAGALLLILGCLVTAVYISIYG